MTSDTFTELLTTFAGFLDYASKATPIVLTIAGLLGYYYREKLKVVLAKSLAIDIESLRHQLSKELADHTATHQRELESYKVSLIAETERAKAVQDVRKTIALRTAERRFEAIAALVDAHLGLDTDVASFVTVPQTDDPHASNAFLERRSELYVRLSKYTGASQTIQLFMPVELRKKILFVRTTMLEVLRLRESSNTAAIPNDHHAITTLLKSSSDLEEDLEKLLQQLEQA